MDLVHLLTVQSNTKERGTSIETAQESVSQLWSATREGTMECPLLQYANNYISTKLNVVGDY